MRVALLAALLLVAPLGLADAPSVHERNVAFVWSLVGNADPQQPATMPDGRVVTLDEAIDALAARAGPVDLAAMASGDAASPILGEIFGATYWGDIWVFEYGPGSCTVTVAGPGSPATVPADPQLYVYQSSFGEMHSPGGYFTEVIAWTLKMSETRSSTPWTLAGLSDFFCISFGADHLAFPFADGWFTWG